MDPPNSAHTLGEAGRTCVPKSGSRSPLLFLPPSREGLSLSSAQQGVSRDPEQGRGERDKHTPRFLSGLAPAAWAQIYLDRNNQPN